MPRLKLKYREGDVFEVPLGDGRRARGVVARATQGPGFLGYFFFGDEPAAQLRPDHAALIARASDLALMGDAAQRRGKGEVRWSVIGHLDDFRRTTWPVPPYFIGGLPPLTPYRLVAYDDDAEQVLGEYDAGPGDERRYPADGGWGSAAVESFLTKILREREAEAAPAPAA